MNKKDMNQRMHLLVYPAKDMAAAKRLFSELLGVASYADSSYYTGFRTGVQGVKDVGRGLLIAQVRDANGNTIGLRQQS